MREETRAHLRPVQGQPLGGAAVVAAGLGERRPQGRAGRVVQDLLLRRRDPPLAQDLARPQAAVTAAAALGPLARRPAGEAQKLLFHNIRCGPSTFSIRREQCILKAVNPS